MHARQNYHASKGTTFTEFPLRLNARELNSTHRDGS